MPAPEGWPAQVTIRLTECLNPTFDGSYVCAWNDVDGGYVFEDGIKVAFLDDEIGFSYAQTSGAEDALVWPYDFASGVPANGHEFTVDPEFYAGGLTSGRAFFGASGSLVAAGTIAALVLRDFGFGH